MTRKGRHKEREHVEDGTVARSDERADGARPDEETTEPSEAADDIAELRGELENLNGKWLRALADLDNYKKRVERDRRRWSDSAREEVLLDLLDVVDNFERALACEGGDDSLREGVELILKQLADVLRKHGVVAIETAGCEFDPNVHEAVGHVESDGHNTNHVVEETQRGYMMGDRLLRCSKVVVCK